MLRRAVEEDLPRLVELWMEMMRGHEDFDPRVVLTAKAATAYRDYLQSHMRSAKSVVVVAEAEGDGVVGFCSAYMSRNLSMFAPEEFGYISDLAVAPSYQRRGVGTQLLEYVTEWFRRYDIRCVQLQVYSHNRVGRDFWAARGFKPFVERQWLEL